MLTLVPEMERLKEAIEGPKSDETSLYEETQALRSEIAELKAMIIDVVDLVEDAKKKNVPQYYTAGQVASITQTHPATVRTHCREMLPLCGKGDKDRYPYPEDAIIQDTKNYKINLDYYLDFVRNRKLFKRKKAI